MYTWIGNTRQLHYTRNTCMTDAKQGQLQVKATVVLWVEVLKLAVSIQTKALAESRKISYSNTICP